MPLPPVGLIEDLKGSAVRTFKQISQAWRLTANEQRQILAVPDLPRLYEEVQGMIDDSVLMQIGYILSIYGSCTPCSWKPINPTLGSIEPTPLHCSVLSGPSGCCAAGMRVALRQCGPIWKLSWGDPGDTPAELEPMQLAGPVLIAV